MIKWPISPVADLKLGSKDKQRLSKLPKYVYWLTTESSAGPILKLQSSSPLPGEGDECQRSSSKLKTHRGNKPILWWNTIVLPRGFLNISVNISIILVQISKISGISKFCSQSLIFRSKYHTFRSKSWILRFKYKSLRSKSQHFGRDLNLFGGNFKQFDWNLEHLVEFSIISVQLTEHFGRALQISNIFSKIRTFWLKSRRFLS